MSGLAAMGFGLGLLANSYANIFLPDDRFSPTVDDARYRSIVQINGWAEAGTEENCTGTLIAENWVLTAAHCIAGAVNSADQNRGYARLFLRPVYVTSPVTRQRTQVDEMRFGRRPIGENHSQDWALLRIRAAWGQTLGWMEMDREIHAQTPPGTEWELPGFSLDRSGLEGLHLTVARNCGPREYLPGGLILHDCDLRVGASGGPLLRCVPGEPCRITAVVRGEQSAPGVVWREAPSIYADYDPRVANVSVSVRNLRWIPR